MLIKPIKVAEIDFEELKKSKGYYIHLYYSMYYSKKHQLCLAVNKENKISVFEINSNTWNLVYDREIDDIRLETEKEIKESSRQYKYGLILDALNISLDDFMFAFPRLEVYQKVILKLRFGLDNNPPLSDEMIQQKLILSRCEYDKELFEAIRCLLDFINKRKRE